MKQFPLGGLLMMFLLFLVGCTTTNETFTGKSVFVVVDNNGFQTETTDTFENRIHQAINNARIQVGLNPLQWDEKLSEIAHAHSRDMITRNYYGHLSPEGHDFEDRYEEAGYHCFARDGWYYYVGGENIHRMYLYDSDFYVNEEHVSRTWRDTEAVAQLIVDGWLDSPSHKKNLLARYWKTAGVGVVVSEDDLLHVTQNFC